jgi:hypothetical protein
MSLAMRELMLTSLSRLEWLAKFRYNDLEGVVKNVVLKEVITGKESHSVSVHWPQKSITAKKAVSNSARMLLVSKDWYGFGKPLLEAFRMAKYVLKLTSNPIIPDILFRRPNKEEDDSLPSRMFKTIVGDSLQLIRHVDLDFKASA